MFVNIGAEKDKKITKNLKVAQGSQNSFQLIYHTNYADNLPAFHKGNGPADNNALAH